MPPSYCFDNKLWIRDKAFSYHEGEWSWQYWWYADDLDDEVDDEVDDDITNASDVALKCCEILTSGMDDDYEMTLRL